MKKYMIFYVIDTIWIILFLVLAIMENSSTKTGLPAIGSLGRFALFSLLCIVGIIILVIVVIIQIISMKKK
ncbi:MULTISPECIES: hypothetical protein [Clostridium]|uniref:hypothetical protein n=1 Tax=Clostridium TaxID=1485 RepID=UPI000826539A|nr:MULTISPECIES: hypothetical protein [Clostridium]PJI09532.1 hypothetical protein CUB90_17420 [Clostridium sp. CT7]